MSDIEFDFITLSPDGLLLYQGPLEKDSNNGAKDFIAVPLVGGRIQVHISLGHEPVVVKMDKGPRLDDGEWHTVHVSRRLKV
jgi:protocadherin Fat 1/2/3